MILNPREITTSAGVRVGLYGIPGVGKSTTGLSAPNVLFIDADKGWKRIPAQFKTASRIEPNNYTDLLNDLTADNVKLYETIVIDTGGALLQLMKIWAIKKNPKNAQNDGVTISLKGYGAIGAEFERLTTFIYSELNKNLVVIFHAKEELDGDRKVYRLDVEGQTRNNVWKAMDLFGFMEVVGDRIMVGFSPTDRYQAKGTCGVSGIHELPNVMKGARNDFLSRLFETIQDNSKTEIEMGKKYDEIMKKVSTTISNVVDGPTATAALETIKAMDHVFASLRESKEVLKGKTDSLGLRWTGDKFEVTK
jgi:hypothetical protein